MSTTSTNLIEDSTLTRILHLGHATAHLRPSVCIACGSERIFIARVVNHTSRVWPVERALAVHTTLVTTRLTASRVAPILGLGRVGLIPSQILGEGGIGTSDSPAHVGANLCISRLAGQLEQLPGIVPGIRSHKNVTCVPPV
jgi:hypothetical protein